MNDEVAQMIVDRLDRMDADRDDARREAKEERGEIISEIREVREIVKEQNGRIGKLELWRHGMEVVAQTRSWRWPAAVSVGCSLIAGVAIGLILHAVGGG